MEEKTMSETDVKIHKILDLCLRLKAVGVDCFFNYSPHIQQIEIRNYYGEWNETNGPDELRCYIDGEYTPNTLDDIIFELSQVLEEHN